MNRKKHLKKIKEKYSELEFLQTDIHWLIANLENAWSVLEKIEERECFECNCSELAETALK